MKKDIKYETEYLKMRDRNVEYNPWREFVRIGDAMFSKSEIGKPLGLWEEVKQYMEEQEEMYNDRYTVLLDAYKELDNEGDVEAVKFRLEELVDVIKANLDEPEEHPLTKEHLTMLEATVKQVEEVTESLYGQIEEL